MKRRRKKTATSKASLTTLQSNTGTLVEKFRSFNDLNEDGWLSW
jgi:hypothetical protein